MKRCNTCNIEKEYMFFAKNKSIGDGYNRRCKECVREYNLINREKIRSKCNEYYNNNKEKNKEYRNKNKERIKQYDKKYNVENKSTKRTADLKWKKKNRDKVNKILQKYNLTRYHNDPEFRLVKTLRHRINKAIKQKHTVKKQSTLILLGCSVQECRQYLESQFKEGMSWSNHGTIWEIDHIVPCSKFDLTKLEEQQKCFHYTNLQPLFKTTTIAESFGYYNELGNRNKYNNI